MKFLEATKYLVHWAELPGVLLGGNLRESPAALQINSCMTSGRRCATAFLFQRVATMQPTRSYYCFSICFSRWFLLTFPVRVAASHCTPYFNWHDRNGKGSRCRNLHGSWALTALSVSLPPHASCLPAAPTPLLLQNDSTGTWLALGEPVSIAAQLLAPSCSRALEDQEHCLPSAAPAAGAGASAAPPSPRQPHMA